MYEYVSRREVAVYKAYYSDVLNRLKMELEKEYAIRAYVTLIGSGAENMVTRNGKETFDLDYNLVLTYVPQEYEKSLKRLKDLIREKGGQSRLVHDKKKDIFIWNQIRDSGDLDKKVAMIKKNGHWNDVRKNYKELKNGYLREGDKQHPSFVVYIQAVNQVYHAMKQGN